MRMINRNFVRIWRVVVKPKYRSIGLGVKLVQDTLHMLDVPYVEIMAVMANYNPFPEKAGMMRVPTESYINHDKGYLNALKKLRELGFDLDLLRSKNYCMSQLLIKLTKQQQEVVRKLVYDHFSIRWKKSSLRKRVYDGDLGATADALANHRLPYAYLIWKNPCQKFKKYPEPLLPVEVRT